MVAPRGPTDPIVVVSTSYNVRLSWALECLESVATQTVPARHVYIAEGAWISYDRIRAAAALLGSDRIDLQKGLGRSAAENIYETVRALPPETIVLCLDGDDYLLHDGAIERVMREYDRGALATYGQFEPLPACSLGPWRANEHSAAVVRERSYRRDEWRATHLRTFRAGLFHEIRRTDLEPAPGTWLRFAVDRAIMLAILEMAGERARFIPDPIYGYRMNNPASAHNAHDAERLAAGRKIATRPIGKRGSDRPRLGGIGSGAT